MSGNYRIGDLVHIPQAVELLDCHNDGAQMTIPLRVQTTENPKIGVVTETNMGTDYLMVLCEGDIWSVRARSVYSLPEKKND